MVVRSTESASAARRVDDGNAPAFVGIRSAELLSLSAGGALVRSRRASSPEAVPIAEFVERELLERALVEKNRVLVERESDGTALVIGVLQTRLPETLRIEAQKLELTGREEITLRSGRAGLRLKADGSVELVGARISAASRGLLRLVGKALRLN